MDECTPLSGGAEVEERMAQAEPANPDGSRVGASQSAGAGGGGGGGDGERRPIARGVLGAQGMDLHSSTSQLNLSRI